MRAWCGNGFLTSGHHWRAGFAAADLSWAAGDHRLGSDWFARLRHYTHTASRARPESKRERVRWEIKETTSRRSAQQFHNNWLHIDLVFPVRPWIPLQKWFITFSPNHCPGYCSSGRLFPWNSRIITQRCLIGAKQSKNKPLMLALQSYQIKKASANGCRPEPLLSHWPFPPASFAKW